METKLCKKCNTVKSVDEFNKHSHHYDGLTTQCRSCIAQSRKYIHEPYWQKRERSLKYRYGLTIEQYNELFKVQNGCCAVCGKHQSMIKRPLGVDHNHTTGQVRGLVCQKCNLAIGLYETTTVYERIETYLAHYTSVALCDDCHDKKDAN